MILLTGCNFNNSKNASNKDKKLLSKIEKTYEDYTGYKCKSNMKIISGDAISEYTIEETYNKSNDYRLEILSPEESEGIVILNTDGKIFVEHPSINQSISLTAIKSLNNQILVGDFLKNLGNIISISREEIDGKEHIVFELNIDEKNKYRDLVKIWVRKKDFVPYKLNVLDYNGLLQMEITYEDFKFIKN
jgi:outer membrane lipoprotein-sorting protein